MIPRDGTGPFDPSDPPRLAGPDGGPGRIVMLSVSARGWSEGWGTSIATALARAWSGTRTSVVLVDASFRAPGLGLWLGTHEGPGLAETLEGASTVQEAVQDVGGERFSLIPPGRALSDPSLLLKSERWHRLCETFVQAGVTLVVFTPADAAWASLVATRADDVIGIASPEDTLPRDVVPADKLRAIVAPPEAGPGSSDDAVTHTHEGDLLDPLAMDPFARPSPPRETWGAVSTEGSAAFGDSDRPDGAGWTGTPPKPWWKRLRVSGSQDFGRSLVHAAALAAVVVGVLAWTGWWSGPSGDADGSGLPHVPDATAPARDSMVEPTEAVDAADARPIEPDARGTFDGTPTFSIALASYRDRGTARRHAERVMARGDTVLVVVTPVDVGGNTFHRVLAGSYGDSIRAEAAKADLERWSGEAADAWLVRRSQLAYEMGVWDTPADAAGHVDRLSASGIDGYVLWDSTPDAGPRFRVYAGAFGTADEATALEALLAAHDLSGALTTRRGSARPFTTR